MRNPKIKDVHGVLYLNGRIRIGTDFGYAAEIDDPEGKFAPLIRLLDGSNTLEDLVAQVAPKLTRCVRPSLCSGRKDTLRTRPLSRRIR